MPLPQIRPEDFYTTYDKHREYVIPEVKKKHIRDFRKNFWIPCEFKPGMSVLEIGCGTGLFLKYIEHEGISDYLGIDTDAKVLEFMPEELNKKIRIIDVNEFFPSLKSNEQFDRVVMIDVLEHFSPGEGVKLLEIMKPFLKKNGRIVVRVPNLASPWGQDFHFGDLTHKAAYTPRSLRQLGFKAGYFCKVFESRRGNPRKQFIEDIFHSTIELFITERPEIWSANIIGCFQPE